MRIIPFIATDNYRTWKTRMPKLAMRTFASINLDKPGVLQVGKELSDLSRH